jgi:hypothetical protein
MRRGRSASALEDGARANPSDPAVDAAAISRRVTMRRTTDGVSEQ